MSHSVNISNVLVVQGPNKKRKTVSSSAAKTGDRDARTRKQASKTKDKGKAKAFERITIPIPSRNDDGDAELSEEDLDLLEEYGSAVSFLQRLDEKGIARCVVCISHSQSRLIFV